MQTFANLPQNFSFFSGLVCPLILVQWWIGWRSIVRMMSQVFSSALSQEHCPGEWWPGNGWNGVWQLAPPPERVSVIQGACHMAVIQFLGSSVPWWHVVPHTAVIDATYAHPRTTCSAPPREHPAQRITKNVTHEPPPPTRTRHFASATCLICISSRRHTRFNLLFRKEPVGNPSEVSLFWPAYPDSVVFKMAAAVIHVYSRCASILQFKQISNTPNSLAGKTIRLLMSYITEKVSAF